MSFPIGCYSAQDTIACLRSCGAKLWLNAGALERFVPDPRERSELLSAVAAACEAAAEVMSSSSLGSLVQ